MVSQIEREKNKKRTMLIYLITGGICYIYMILCILHFNAILTADPRAKAMDALNRCFIEVFTKPLDIFPINGTIIMWSILLSILAGTFLTMVIMDKKLRAHDNPETVNGSATFMDKKEADRFCFEKASPIGQKGIDIDDNIILSRDLFLSIDERKTHLVPNIVVSARAGAGKGQGIVDPNILQNFASQLVTDPSGELYRRYAKYKENNGYVVNCLNLEKLRDGSKYNPLAYIREEKDVDILVQCLMDNLKEEGEGGGEQFWNDTAKLFIESLILYLWHVAPKEEQTFEHVLQLMHLSAVDENNADYESDLDLKFSALEEIDPNNLAVKRYQDFKIGAGKTLKSILITVTSKLKKFELEDVAYATSEDEMDLTHFADTKHILFVIVPTGDAGTYNFLASMLYTQIFQEIYRYGNNRVMYSSKVFTPRQGIFKVYQGRSEDELKQCMREAKKFAKEIRNDGCSIAHDKKRDVYLIKTKNTKQVISWRGTKEEAIALAKELREHIRVDRVQDMSSNKVPTPVQFVLDEFKSTGKIPAFTDKISTVRKYGVSIIIILQSYSQLEIMYDKEAPTIMSNCPIKILMGMSDAHTIKAFTEVTGKKTTTVENTSYQANGNGSSSYNKSSLELITPDMVAKLGYKYFYVLIDEFNPYYGKKFLVDQHPKYKIAKSTEGKFYNKNEGKSKPLLPLRQRIEMEKAAKEAGKATDVPAPAKDQAADKQNSVQNIAGGASQPQNPTKKPSGSPKNDARKKEAAEAKAALEAMEAPGQGDDMINDALMASLGITEQSTDTEIKEVIESVIVLDNPSLDTITYNLTN